MLVITQHAPPPSPQMTLAHTLVYTGSVAQCAAHLRDLDI